MIKQNKKRSIIAILLLVFSFGSLSARQAFNRPKSAKVVASSTNIPTSFSNASGSLVLQGLQSGDYQHLSVINDTNSPISIITIPEVSSAPGSHLNSQKLYVVSQGAHAFDGISVFDNIYLKSEDNTILAGTVYIHAW